jgi:hypothetical protein
MDVNEHCMPLYIDLRSWYLELTFAAKLAAKCPHSSVNIVPLFNRFLVHAFTNVRILQGKFGIMAFAFEARVSAAQQGG